MFRKLIFSNKFGFILETVFSYTCLSFLQVCLALGQVALHDSRFVLLPQVSGHGGPAVSCPERLRPEQLHRLGGQRKQFASNWMPGCQCYKSFFFVTNGFFWQIYPESHYRKVPFRLSPLGLAPVACTINIVRSSIGNHHSWCLNYKLINVCKWCL